MPCFQTEPLLLDRRHAHRDGRLPAFCSSFLRACRSPVYVPVQGFLGGLLRVHFSLLVSTLLTSSAGFARGILQVLEASLVCAVTFQLVSFQLSTFISSNPHQLCQPSLPCTVPLTHLRCLQILFIYLLFGQGPCWFFLIILIVNFWLCRIFIVGFSLVVVRRGCSDRGAQASYGSGLSCCGAQALDNRLNSSVPSAQLL